MTHASPASGVLCTRAISLIAALIVTLLLPSRASALTKTIEIPFNWTWTTTSWGCGDSLPILRSGTIVASFAGSLPPESKVTSVKITMPMKRAGIVYAYGDADPVVALSLNGQSVGSPVVASGYVQCPMRESLIDYTFEQALAPGAYNLSGTNSLMISVEGGTCPYWCGVTVIDPIVSIEVTYDPPPAVEFAIKPTAPEAQRRILLSNARLEYPYPHFQSIGAQDAAVSTFLRTRNASGIYQPGLTVYMRILDPPDAASYANLPGNVLAKPNDNRGSAILEGEGVSIFQPGIYQATSGASGLVNFTLRLQSPFAAGDNVQIEASLDPTFAEASSVKSGTMTAWKRVFVEKRLMLKNGLFLSRAASAGDTEIYTWGNKYGGNDGTNKLSKGERILLVHGPQLDGSDTDWYMEEHTILEVEAIGGGEWRVALGTKTGKTVTPELLLRDYEPDNLNPAVGDAISHLSGTTLSADDYHDAGNDLVTGSVFPEAFVEYIVLPYPPGSTVPMPYLASATQSRLQALVDRWSSVVTSATGLPRALPNHQLLVIAASDGTPGAAGVTTHMVPGETSSWVFRQTIEGAAKGKNANAELWSRKTAVHELAHQWKSNTVFNDWDHCGVDSKAFDQASIYCLLAKADKDKSETQRANGIARFHLVPQPGSAPGSGAWHSEYFEIRKRTDPFRP